MKYRYFDYAAATPLDNKVLQVMEPLQKDLFYNPSANYGPAEMAKKKIDESKEIIAKNLGVKSTEIILTSGGSESNNLAINGVMQDNPGAKILISAIEHKSVLAPAEQYNHELVCADKKGRLDLEDLVKKIDDEVVLVSIIHASNEIGTVQPIKEVSQIIKTVRSQRQKTGSKTPIYLHIDACQTASILDIHAHSLGVDMMTINGAKIYGPPQSGILFVGSNVSLQPQILGGRQQRGLRAGTLNAAFAYGLAVALDIAQTQKTQEQKRLRLLQQDLENFIEKSFSAAKINGSSKYRLPNTTSVSFPGQDNERLLLRLESEGILASAGSACGASEAKQPHILKAIGLDQASAKGTLRFSMGRHTTQADVDHLKKVLTTILQ